MKALLCFFLAISLMSFAPHSVKNEAYLLQKIQSLPQTGILKQSHDGYVYLKVSDDYVNVLFPLLEMKDFKIPNSFHRNSPIRAHISVMYKDDGMRLSPIKELGQVYSFIPTHVAEVRSGSKEYVIVEVSAPALEDLRTSYGLSPKLLNHEFHISIAEKHLH